MLLGLTGVRDSPKDILLISPDSDSRIDTLVAGRDAIGPDIVMIVSGCAAGNFSGPGDFHFLDD